ncbi:unnamed protein product [Miscanthus lutarioriparius]|uniref:Uncharacterized protein n=1 Tax=Miscanthus lutarioriparius TaxID=422564 RepID=A0A811SIK4_9POAL|nr:unnamed protein product [Miscanthus lutarioriparius]
MEGGGWAVGGHVLGAAQEPRGQQQQQQREQDEKEAGAAAERKKGGGGGMKFRVRARAPHGVGALLLIGGAAVVGAAVLAWRRSRHGKKDGAVDQPERRLPAKEEVLDGGIVEDGKVQGDSLVQELDQSDEKLSAGNTDIGSSRLDSNVSEESHQIHMDDEITADQLESKHVEKIDENSGSNPVEVHDLESKHEEKIDEISSSNPVEVHTHDLDKEYVEKVEQKSSCNHVEITAHDMVSSCLDNEHVEKIHVQGIDQSSSRNPVEIIMQEMVNVCLVSGSVEKVEKDSSKDIEKEIAQKDNEDMEASDQSKLCIKGPGIILSKHNDESDGTQEAESMENTPTAQLMMHQDQLLDDMVTDTVTETEDTVADTEDIVTETEEAKQGERTITDKGELEQDEKKDLVGPALSSLVKPIVKKEPEFPRPNETGMKIEQDYTNGELSREHTDLISKGGAMQGEGDMATMDCRSSALVVIALILALAMGITIIVRLYAPSRATKLQMDLP